MSYYDDASLMFLAGGGAQKDGTAYSVKPIPEYSSELITNGDFATDSDWNKGGGATISGGQANIIGGGGYVSITQNSVFTAGKKYRVSVDVVINSGLGLKFQDGANNENIGFATSSGTYVFIFTAGSNTSFVVGRRTGGTAFNSSVDNVSVKEYIEDDIPRIDYSTGSEALLLEPQGTNLVSYSEDFSSLNIRNNAVVTSNAIISPSGLLDADEITFDGTGAGRVEASIPVTIGQPYTISLYLKNKDLSNVTQVWVGFSGGSQGQYVTITNEWQRYDITTDADGATEYPRIQFSGTGSLYAWGFQTEQRSFATSYIPTSGTTVTRVGETCVNATPEINSEEGVLYAEISALADDGTFRLISLSDGTNNNTIKIGYRSNSNAIYFEIRSSGASQSFYFYTTTGITNFHKVAVSYKDNDFALWIDGTEVYNDTSGIVPLGLNVLNFTRGDASGDFYGNTKDLQYFNKALGDYQLAQLTTI